MSQFYVFSSHLTKERLTNMMDKVFRISHSKYHEKNLKFIIKTFIENGYPIEFIFDTIQD